MLGAVPAKTRNPMFSIMSSVRHLVVLALVSGAMAGAFADILVDKMRGSFEDLNIEYNFIGVSGIYTPMRQFMVSFACVCGFNTISLLEKLNNT